MSSARPTQQLAVVACMDARLDVYAVLGIGPGDAHIIRNAGGVVSDDVIRSLAISQRKLGTTRIVLIHHTGCGMDGLDSDAFVKELRAETGSAPSWPVHGFSGVEDDVRASIQRIRSDAFIPHRDDIRGYVCDIETGELVEVV